MPAYRKKFTLEIALQVLEDVKQWVKPFSNRHHVVGSVRRCAKIVHDLDLLIIPVRNPLCNNCEFPCTRRMTDYLSDVAFDGHIHLIPTGDNKLFSFIHMGTGMRVDLHVVWSMEDWWIKLFALTGSNKQYKYIRKSIKDLPESKKIFAYHPDGRIEKSKGDFVWPKNELGVFRALGLPYQPPEQRI